MISILSHHKGSQEDGFFRADDLFHKIILMMGSGLGVEFFNRTDLFQSIGVDGVDMRWNSNRKFITDTPADRAETG